MSGFVGATCSTFITGLLLTLSVYYCGFMDLLISTALNVRILFNSTTCDEYDEWFLLHLSLTFKCFFDRHRLRQMHCSAVCETWNVLSPASMLTLWATNNPSAPPDKIPSPAGNSDQSLAIDWGLLLCVFMCVCVCILSSRGNSLLLGTYGMQPCLAFITLGSPFNSFGRKWNTRMALLQSAGAICSQGRDIPEHVFHIKRGAGSHRCMLTGCVWYVCVCVCAWLNVYESGEGVQASE